MCIGWAYKSVVIQQLRKTNDFPSLIAKLPRPHAYADLRAPHPSLPARRRVPCGSPPTASWGRRWRTTPYSCSTQCCEGSLSLTIQTALQHTQQLCLSLVPTIQYLKAEDGKIHCSLVVHTQCRIAVLLSVEWECTSITSGCARLSHAFSSPPLSGHPASSPEIDCQSTLFFSHWGKLILSESLLNG